MMTQGNRSPRQPVDLDSRFGDEAAETMVRISTLESPRESANRRSPAANRRDAIRAVVARWSQFGAPVLCCLLAVLVSMPAHADKVRDLVQVAGVRSNQLIGYGLVVGLDGSGDQSGRTLGHPSQPPRP